MASYIRRRKFLATLLSGAAVAWPLAARAQQSERMRRIGVLMNLAESDPEGQARIAAFREGLAKLGWTEGRDVQIEYRWFAGEQERASAYAAELVQFKPDVIFAGYGTLIGGVATGNPELARRIRTSLRSSRRGVRRKLGTARQQYHRVRSV